MFFFLLKVNNDLLTTSCILFVSHSLTYPCQQQAATEQRGEGGSGTSLWRGVKRVRSSLFFPSSSERRFVLRSWTYVPYTHYYHNSRRGGLVAQKSNKRRKKKHWKERDASHSAQNSLLTSTTIIIIIIDRPCLPPFGSSSEH